MSEHSYVDQLAKIAEENDGDLPKLEVHRLLLAADEKREELKENLAKAVELIMTMDEHRNVIEAALKNCLPNHIAYQDELQAIRHLAGKPKLDLSI